MVMKRVSILVPRGAILGSIEGPRQVLSESNKYLESVGREPMFEISLAALTPETPAAGGRYRIFADKLIGEIQSTDLIIIPALDGDIPQLLEANKEFIPWIVQRYNEGADVASLCVGAFLLASTGLINGKRCATHWMFANYFRKMFPQVNLVEDKIITDENGIYSSGGAFSYLNLILYLVEKFAGRDIAVFMSKAFQIDIERRSQSPFQIFHGQKDHEDEPIIKAQEFIEKNFSDRISVEQLSSMIALSRRNFERRFKKATSNTVMEYIQRVKIEAAKKGLETGRKTVNEVMYDVGYSDPKAFRVIFKKITGLTPVEYKNRYNKESLALMEY